MVFSPSMCAAHSSASQPVNVGIARRKRPFPSAMVVPTGGPLQSRDVVMTSAQIVVPRMTHASPGLEAPDPYAVHTMS